MFDGHEGKSPLKRPAPSNFFQNPSHHATAVALLRLALLETLLSQFDGRAEKCGFIGGKLFELLPYGFELLPAVS